MILRIYIYIHGRWISKISLRCTSYFTFSAIINLALDSYCVPVRVFKDGVLICRSPFYLGV